MRKGRFLDDVVHERDRVGLRVARVDSESSDASCIVDGRVLVASDRSALGALQGEELDVHLHVMARDLLFVAVRVYGTPSDSCREPVEAVTAADPVDGCVGNRDAVITLQVPNDALRPHVVAAA
jgi:hypothetical protein